MKLGFNIIFVCLLATQNLLAQVYPAKHYGLKEGLPNTYITQIFQDSSGNMWFPTLGGGIAKFNGTSFKNYGLDQGLKTELVRCITADKSGKLYFGTFGDGVYRLEGDSLISLCNKELPKEIFAVKGDRYGNVWVGTENGLYQILPDRTCINYTTKLDLPPGPVTHISEDKQGNIWFGYDEYVGLFKLSLPTAEHVLRYDSTNGLTSGRILHSFHDSEGNTWVSAYDGLYRIKDGQSVAEKIKNKDIPAYYLFEIVEIKPGLLLIGSQEEGVLFYDSHANRVLKHIDGANGLKSQTAFRIFMDTENNLWISSWGQGVSRLNFSGWSKVDQKKGLSSKFVYRVSVLDNKLLFATSEGMAVYDNGVVSKLFPELIQDDVSAFLVHENLIFCAKEKSLRIIDTERNSVLVKQDENLKAIKAITKGQDGKVYFASWTGGISVYDKGQFSKITDSLASLVQYYYAAYTSSNGTIWFGSWEGGVVYLQGGKWKILSTADGLPSNKVTSIAEDASGNMIFGTNGGGVAILSGSQVKIINSKNGLLSNSVFSVICDDKNNLWIGCQGGVSRYDLKKRTIRNYDFSVGFDGDCLLGSVAKKDGAIWVGTNNYLWKYDEDDVIETRPSLRVIIERVRVNNSPLAQEQKIFTHTQNKFTFEYYSSQMLQNEKVLFQYRLVGIDEEFSPPTAQKEVSFIELPPGKYTFELKACLEGVCSEEGTFFTFEISPPFWQTWWFRTLFTLVFITLLYILYRWRTATLRRRQVELEKTVRKRTSEVVAEKREVERQKHLVEEKNKEILDSINYAKRLQDAILPPTKVVKSYLSESFILYKPKDIVAGDFYFMDVIEEGGKKLVYYVAADCTGHGVPGAMVSILGANGLKRCLQEFRLRKPGEILDKLSELVAENFSQSEEQIRDGMDLALCCLEMENESAVKVHYAGANNPLWIVRKQEEKGVENTTHSGGYELTEVKADKQAIGYTENTRNFQTHTIPLQKGDTIYTFTDGYQDQFGGEKGKKFKTSKLKELLLSVQSNSMSEQKEIINETFENWKGSLEQIDDVCVIGVRL